MTKTIPKKGQRPPRLTRQDLSAVGQWLRSRPRRKDADVGGRTPMLRQCPAGCGAVETTAAMRQHLAQECPINTVAPASERITQSMLIELCRPGKPFTIHIARLFYGSDQVQEYSVPTDVATLRDARAVADHAIQQSFFAADGYDVELVRCTISDESGNPVAYTVASGDSVGEWRDVTDEE